MKLKKVIYGMMITATLTAAGAISSFAAETQTQRPACFVDADQNGICDNCTGERQGQRRDQKLQDGSGKGRGVGTGMRRNFVDNNKDGINDNYGLRCGANVNK